MVEKNDKCCFMHRIGFTMNYTIDTPQWVAGCAVAVISYFAPVHTLIILALVFVGIDFITGVWASHTRAKREGRLDKWGFESSRARNTVFKLVFIMAGIILSWLIQKYILTEIGVNIKLDVLFTGFACGVEFWSYLENAAEISNHPVFKWLKKFMKMKIEKALDTEIGDEEKPKS